VEKMILIVVRDRDMRQLLVQTFTGRGFRVLAASDTVGGLFQFGLAQPNLVVLDANGWEALRRIRALSSVPVIMLIEDDPKARIDSLNQGADYFVTKPPSLQELDAKVRALFRRELGTLAAPVAVE
jgi:DNA-binding response OmpR family regulator